MGNGMVPAIPEDEWVLLANAVADPLPGMIAVECVSSEQMAEVERRLLNLAGNRPLLRQIAQPGEETPETAWQRARQLSTDSHGGSVPPLLLLKFDAPPPPDAAARERLASFWRGMNQLRENWHDLPAQIVFLLSPAAYEHLSLNADHLKSWISLKVHFWPGATEQAVLDRPGRGQTTYAPQDAPRDSALTRQQLALLARQYQEAGSASAPALRLRRYLLPLIEGLIAQGDLEAAQVWRQHIAPDWPLEKHDKEALSLLDERLQTIASPRPRFDVFLSHNSRDKPAVRELARALREQGLIVWLDEDELRPGLAWQAAIEAGIRQSASVAVLIGKDGLGPWAAEEMRAAIQLALKNDQPIIPVLLPDAPSTPELPLFLGSRTWVDLRPALNAANLGRLIWGITGRKPDVLPSPTGGGAGGEGARPDLATTPPPSTIQRTADNPYAPWTPATPPRFFGREKLLRRLGEALDHGRSVSLVGEARIGKSSLLATWAELARQRGRVVRQLNGEGPEGLTCQGFVAAVSGQADAGHDPDDAAEQLLQWVQRHSPTLPPLILVDEAERPFQHLPHRFFERLRGMLGEICLIFASRHEIGDIARDDGLTSPLMNRLELQRLGLLEETGVAGLIGLGADLLAPADGDLMREWAGRHPFYLALLGHYLWDARRHGDSIEEALEAFQINAHARLDEIQRSLSEMERSQLRGLLNPILRTATALAMRNDPNSLPRLFAMQAALASLKRRGLLDDGRPFGRVLTEWLKARS